MKIVRVTEQIENEGIIGGVVQNNNAEWLHEDADFDAVNLDWEQHLLDCEEEEHDFCWEYNGSETILIGFVECSIDDPDRWYELTSYENTGRSIAFKLDPNAEYSAIYGEIYTQVVKSQWVTKSRLCSPCFPGQGDVDSSDDENGYWTYNLPPDVYGDFLDND